MSAWIMPSANGRAQFPSKLDPTRLTSPVDTWIGRRVRVRRNSYALTQEEFSELLNIDRQDLAGFEAGTKRINANLLFRIAKSLDVRPAYFFRGYQEEDWKAL